jgi:hypothetical protein
MLSSVRHVCSITDQFGMNKAIETNNNKTMQNYYKTIGALVVASAFAAGNASAEIESEIHAGYTNEYLFRGIDLGSNLVEAGVDVSTEYNGLGLSAGAWYGSFDAPTGIPQIGGAYSTSELDLYAEVSKDLGFLTAAVGYIAYINDDTTAKNLRLLVDDAQEVYFSVAKSLYGIDYSLTYFWDIETDNDGYAELAGSKGFELSPCLTLNTGAALGYLAEQGQVGHLTAKVSLDYAYSETATISPFVAHSWSLGDDNDTAYANTGNEFVAGTMLSVSF